MSHNVSHMARIPSGFGNWLQLPQNPFDGQDGPFDLVVIDADKES